MINFLHHLFVPHERNNHRAKILHNKNLFFIVVVLVLLSLSTRFVYQRRPDILGISYSISESQMLVKINQIRESRGLSGLALNGNLAGAAHAKAQDMFSKNYWAHFSPDGSTSPWGFIKGSGYNYLYAGENLAKGFTDSNDVVNAWMNSPSHRDNLLSPKYKDVGFAISEGNLLGEDTVLVVEMFGSREFAQAAPPPPTQINTASVDNPEPAKSVQVPQAEAAPNIQAAKPNVQAAKSAEVTVKPRVDVASYARNISLVLMVILAMTFLGDFLITSHKQIPRLVGHNMDHIMIILFFIFFIILQQAGVIL